MIITPDEFKKYVGDFKNGLPHGRGIRRERSGEKYDGEWKNGKRDGKGELTIFQDPAFVSNKDWTPSIMEKYIGTFQNGEMNGEIKQYDDITKEWTLTSYKNGVVGKSVKINKK